MSPIDLKLAADVVDGKVELLGIEEIVTRLGVSRSTLERWVRNGRAKLPAGMPQGLMSVTGYSTNLFGKTDFPPPDLHIGASPRWKKDTVMAWLVASSQ